MLSTARHLAPSSIKTEKSARTAFQKYPIGFVHIDMAEVRIEEGKLYMLVAIDCTAATLTG